MSVPLVESPCIVVPVLVPERSFRNDLRAIKIVWHRDIIRFWRDKPRIVASLIQPILYLFVLGSGLSSMIPAGRGVPLRTFLFPGVISMSVLFTCFFSAGSLVWDREFGFMREMLVAPVRRGAIVAGKCLGGATAGVLQGALLISIGGLVGIPYDPVLIATLLAELLLLSFALTAFGVLVAVRIKGMQSFMAIMQMLLMPLFFLSGALFPLNGLPGWLTVLTRLDPLTYAVDPMRRAVFERLAIPAAGVTWGGAAVPVAVELGIVAAMSILALTVATAQFSKAD
jgi:daunorubicin resistance ABC transporter membrane protein